MQIELQILTFLIFAVVSGVGIFGTTKIYKEFVAMGNWSLGGETEFWCIFNEQDLIRNIDMMRTFLKPDIFWGFYDMPMIIDDP